jgi:LAS superfamily LD-carboxypeptidase LdcB
MKRIICILVALIVFGTSSFAQQTTTKTAAKTTKTTTAKEAKTTTGKTEVKTKKDGTPDKRYKANKEAAKPATGPLKKDGTPDKRYKANKTTAPKTK